MEDLAACKLSEGIGSSSLLVDGGNVTGRQASWRSQWWLGWMGI